MNTPKEYTKTIERGIISTEILNACLFSVNKRAKNYRDKKRENSFRGYDNARAFHAAETKEREFYKKKEILLSLVSPTCIHKEFVGFERIRVYDYESDFDRKYIAALATNNVVYTNHIIRQLTAQRNILFLFKT